ncbi:bacteriochlorophyll synthase [Allostella vacuolata]|nr:bacteriochlorophyll synthase [Stella vacuolata]
MTARPAPPPLSWLGIVRLGLVQAALGAILVLTTSTLNRVMVVELALPAILPGALVGFHHAIQAVRPRLGHGSDVGGRRTPWIVGGMAVLATGGVLAAIATAWMATDRLAGIALAVLAFALIGLGVGSAATTLMVLLAKRVEDGRRAAAAGITWFLMIAGFAGTAGLAGQFLDPFTPARLVLVTAAVAAAAFLVSLAAVWKIEGPSTAGPGAAPTGHPGFRRALAEVWTEPPARRFAIFVAVSMLAYSAQDLILEPFAGIVFGLPPGQTTTLSGLQHAGVLAGVALVAAADSAFRGTPLASLRGWTIGGCIASALALAGLAAGGLAGPGWPLHANVIALGIANGAFAIAAIGRMMGLAHVGAERREGVRMGLWGGAQAIAFGAGGFLGTVAADLARLFLADPGTAYGLVFAAEALLFLASARLAARIDGSPPAGRSP